MGRFSRYRGITEVAISQLSHERVQTTFAIAGVALAVLSATLLTSVGFGVVMTGQEKFDASGRDIWITGGPTRIQPGTLGGIEGSLYDSHALARDIGQRERVRSASPMLFQTVYFGNGSGKIDTVLAVGVPGVGGDSINLESGSGFSQSGYVHYADGNYTGPRTHEVILDPRLSERYSVGVGDSANVGGTIVDAEKGTHRIVGTSRTFSTFLGTPVITIPLSELQTMTGATQTDAATLITIDVANDASVSSVQADLERRYPQYTVRTNSEQLEAVLANQALVIASGLVLVVLGIVSGLALTVNILSLLVFHQERAFAAIRATGISGNFLVGMVAIQGVFVAALGGIVGIALTPLFGHVLSLVAQELVGFEGLVRTPDFVYGIGLIVAWIIGTLSAIIAGKRVVRGELQSALRQ